MLDYVRKLESNNEDPYGYVHDILSLGRESAVKSNLIKKYDYNLVWNDEHSRYFSRTGEF